MTQQVLWLVLFAVLGPLLGPRAYGLFALAMVFVGFFELVLAEAAAEALLSMPQMTDAHFAVANLLNVLAGVLAGAVILCLGPPLALLAHEPGFAAMMAALAPLPLLSSLTAAPTAYLKRQGRFRQFALRSIAGLSIGGALGVTAALLGAGAWSLVIQIMAQRAAEVVILWAASLRAARIGWRPEAYRDLASCAVNVALARSSTWIAGQAPRLIVGAILGPTVLGLFTIAARVTDVLVQVVLVPATQIARLEMSLLAADALSVRTAFARLLGDLSIAAFPVGVGMAAVAPVLFQDWLGPKWAGAGAATAILALTLCPWTVFYSSTAVFMGVRMSGLESRIQAALAVTSALATLIAAPFGLNWICGALLLRLMLLLALPVSALRRPLGHGALHILRPLIPPLAAAAAMGVAVSVATPFLAAALGPLLTLPSLVALGALVYSGIICLLAPKQVRDLFSALAARPGPLAKAP
jgi:PST family polysaccharide transporter